MKNHLVSGVVIILLLSVAGGVGLYLRGSGQPLPPTADTVPVDTSAAAPGHPAATDEAYDFSDPKKSAHYESNAPAHGEVVPGIPVAVVVDFNFDLAAGSTISISREGRDFGTGPTIIDDNKLAMRRTMDPDAPDGVYTVIYKACWPDRTCHDGFFQFAVDRGRAAAFTDETGKAEVQVDMKNLAFAPPNLRISRGTTVTWFNSDTFDHYVNTDSHPAHTQFLDLNSTVIVPGEQYQFTFDQPGVYDYHCSAHAGVMIGKIIVE